MKTPAQRQEAMRKRRERLGLKRCEFWLSKREAKAVREFIATQRKDSK